MVDFAELWRREAQTRRAPDDAAAWDERAQEAVSKYAPSGYSHEFLRLAELLPGETVFDMGCGAGALAIPCAEQGHRVLAADFSPVMLARCAAGVPADAPGSVTTMLLAWDDDWSAAGLAPRSFDVALASRSIATPDMEAAIKKLSALARRKVCVTLVAGKSPRVADAFFDDLGLTCTGHQDAAFAFGIAAQLGYKPEVRFIESTRDDRYASREAAHDAYLRMLRFADQQPCGAELDKLELQAHHWVDVHVKLDAFPNGAPKADANARPATHRGIREIESDDPWVIDIPRSFSWAFISWEV